MARSKYLYDYGFDHGFPTDTHAISAGDLSAAGVSSWADAVVYGLGEDDSAAALAGSDELTAGEISDAVAFAIDSDTAGGDAFAPGGISDVVSYDIGESGDG